MAAGSPVPLAACKYCRVEEGDMISCASCKQYSHPSCLELPEHIVPVVKTYEWQCNDCKYCYACHNIENEKKILFCDSCDRGFHTYCVLPPLNRRPRGDWFCSICVEMQEEKEEKERKEQERIDVEVITLETRQKKTKKEKNRSPIDESLAEIVDLTESQRDKRKNERDKTKVLSPSKGLEEDSFSFNGTEEDLSPSTEVAVDQWEEEEIPDFSSPVTPVKPVKRKYTKSSEKPGLTKPGRKAGTKKTKKELEDTSSKTEEKVKEKVSKFVQTIETVEKHTQTVETTEYNSKVVTEKRSVDMNGDENSATGLNSSDTADKSKQDKNEVTSITKAVKNKCLYSRTFSNINQCPFFGCDGTGNTRNNHHSHISLSNCPLSRESKRREKQLLGMHNASSDETVLTPPKKDTLEKIPEVPDESDNDNNNDVSQRRQTPIEGIVSESDIEMFEAAKAKALQEMRKEMAPHPDGLKSIIFGDTEIEAWYKSQYAHDYSMLPKLYICEFCLEYMKTETIYRRHMAKCTVLHPPGDEVYRKDGLSVFEIDGAKATVYCQNLCLMAKLFLDHKTLWADVPPFLFYIMTTCDNRGCHIVGYFSKEKVSFLNYNVSCILVLPHHMRKGYGRLLIDFSYLLTAVEGKTGSPERPLSDLGVITYRKFWAEKLLNYLSTYPDKETISIKGISEKMAMQATDVISTLQYLGMLKYWKGKHVIALRTEVMAEYQLKVKERANDYKEIDVQCLTWTPPSSRVPTTSK